MHNHKMIILMRTDLNMRKGKMISQACHAVLKLALENLNHKDVQTWLSASFTKITLRVESEEQLTTLIEEAESAGILNCAIVDEGRTEFQGVPTMTCGVIGPADSASLDKITGHLTLL